MKKFNKMIVSIMAGILLLSVGIPSYASVQNVNQTQQGIKTKVRLQNATYTDNGGKNVQIKGHSVSKARLITASNKASKTNKNVTIKSNDGQVFIVVDVTVPTFAFLGMLIVIMMNPRTHKYIVKAGGKIVKYGSSLYKKIIHYFSIRRKGGKAGHHKNKRKSTRNKHQKGDKRRYSKEKKVKHGRYTPYKKKR